MKDCRTEVLRVLFLLAGMMSPVFANEIPVANAGADQTVFVDGTCMATVTLDGTGSTDADVGDTLTYTWTGGFTGAPQPVPLRRWFFTKGVYTVDAYR